MANDPIKTITINDGAFSIPIWVEQGIEGLNQNALFQSSIFADGGGAQRYGEGERLFASLEQRDWTGGRANEFFSDDPTRYLDGLNLWSLTPGKLVPSPQWNIATGHRPNGSDADLPGNMDWRALIGDSL